MMSDMPPRANVQVDAGTFCAVCHAEGDGLSLWRCKKCGGIACTADLAKTSSKCPACRHPYLANVLMPDKLLNVHD